MGIEYNSNLIIGWQLDNDKVKSWCEDLGINHLENTFEDKLPIPNNFVLISASPYPDSEFDYWGIYLCYNYNFGERIKFEEMTKILEDKKSFENVKEFVNKYCFYKDKDSEPTVFSVQTVW